MGSDKPNVGRIFETHIPVSNIEESMKFYESTLGLELGTFEDQRRAAFYWVGGRGNSMLGLWEKAKDQIAPQHFAMEIPVREMAPFIRCLQLEGITTKNFYGEETNVPTVFGWMPAASIYFEDPDGHTLELIAMLPDPPQPDRGIVSWVEWKT